MLLIIFKISIGQHVLFMEPLELKEFLAYDFNEVKFTGVDFYRSKNGKFPSNTSVLIIKKIEPNNYLIINKSSTSSISDTTIIRYNSSNDKIYYKRLSKEFKYWYKYDTLNCNNRIIWKKESRVFHIPAEMPNANRDYELLFKYTYNDSCQVVSEIMYDINDTLTPLKTTIYKYRNSQLIKKIEKDIDSGVTTETNYIFKDTLLIKEIRIDYFRSRIYKFRGRLYKQKTSYKYYKNGIHKKTKGLWIIKYNREGKIVYLNKGYAGEIPIKYQYSNNQLFSFSTWKFYNRKYYLVEIN